MAKRVRILIYESTPEQLEEQRLREFVNRSPQGIVTLPNYGREGSAPMTIQSIELSPTRVTLREIVTIARLVIGDSVVEWLREVRG